MKKTRLWKTMVSFAMSATLLLSAAAVFAEAEQTAEAPLTVAETQEAEESANTSVSSLETFKVPYYSYLTDSYGGTFACVQKNAEYTIDSITKSGANENNKVTYTVNYHINMPMEVELDITNTSEWSFSSPYALWDNFRLYDTNTGTMLPYKDITDAGGYTYSTTVNGIDVGYSRSNGTLQSTEWECDWDSEHSGRAFASMTANSVYTITVPKDYDGIMMVLDNRGYTEAVEQETVIFSQSKKMELSNYSTIRISDYAQEDPNASVSEFLEIQDEYTNTTYVRETQEGATIKCSGELSDFWAVYCDDVLIDEANYELKEGSTIITFSQAFMDTLENGEHVFTLCYYPDRLAEVSMTITDSDEVQTPTTSSSQQTDTQATNSVSKTGHTTSVALWLILALVVVGCALAIRKKLQISKNQQNKLK